MVGKIMCMWVLITLATTGACFSGKLCKESGLDYSHPVTSDYVYRTPRVYQSGEACLENSKKPGSWLSLFSFRKKKPYIPAEAGTELSLRIRELVAELFATSSEPVARELQVAVATFVSLDQLYETSSMGRYISEQMLHELQRAGVDVIEVRMMPSMKISKGYGEYILSRDMGELSYLHDVDAVVVGTYTVASGQIFLNGRLLAISTGRILSTASTVFDMDEVTASLLQRSGQPIAPPASIGIQSYDDVVKR